MKTKFIIFLFISIIPLFLNAQNSKLIITPTELTYLLKNVDHLPFTMEKLKYGRANDTTYIKSKKEQFNYQTSKITISKKIYDSSFTLEENINATEELVAFYKNARFRVKQINPNTYMFIQTIGKIEIVQLTLTDETVKLFVIRNNQNKTDNSYTQGLLSWTDSQTLYQKIIDDSKRQSQANEEKKKQLKKEKQRLDNKSDYLKVPFNIDKICTYFGYSNKSLYNQLIYQDIYSSLKDSVQENSLKKLYLSHVKVDYLWELETSAYIDRFKRQQPIFTLKEREKELVGLRYNILSNYTAHYIAQWKKKGATQISSTDETITYEYNYSQQINNGLQFITLLIIVEKIPVKELENRVTILLKNMKTEYYK